VDPLRAARFPFIPTDEPPPLVVGADDVWLEFEGGQRVLDAGGGAVVTNIGHGRPQVAAAAAQALGAVDYVIPPWATESRVALVEELTDHWLPDGFERCGFVSGGSESVDVAVRLARQHHVGSGRPERHKVIGRDVSYHGATLGGLAVGGHDRRRSGLEALLPPMPKSSHHDFEELEKVIEIEGPDTISAFIGEPVIGAAAAAYVPPPDYWPNVVEVCKRHGILVIADEVMTGFGRLGTPMGVDAMGIDADIIVGGKGLAGGYAPMGGVFATNEVVAPVAEAGLTVMYYTFSGQDLCCAISRTVLEIMRNENLVERAAAQGQKLRERLDAEFTGHPNVNDVRGVGLLQGLGLVADSSEHRPFPRSAQFTERVVAAMVERGVWAYPAGSGVFDDALLFGPPFTVTDEHIDIIVGTAREAIDACAQE
jgi:adenosylmethionine-8-amino-7-oxononanoate aminotransferase